VTVKNLFLKRKEKASAYVSKAITGNCPKNIAEKFKISNSERYDLRSNNKFLALPKPKTNSMVAPLAILLLKFGTKGIK
jgi:hypothetical protein